MRTRLFSPVIALILVLANGGAAQAASALRATVLKTFPQKLQQLLEQNGTPSTAEKLLGPPAKKRRGSLYYNLAGRDYDTTLVFRGERLEQVIHRVYPPKLTLQELMPRIPESARKEAEKEMRISSDPGHSFLLRLPEEGMILEVAQSSDKAILGVIVSPLKRAGP